MRNNIFNCMTRDAFDYAGIAPEDVVDIRMQRDHDLVVITFATETMSRTCYVSWDGEKYSFLP